MNVDAACVSGLAVELTENSCRSVEEWSGKTESNSGSEHGITVT